MHFCLAGDRGLLHIIGRYIESLIFKKIREAWGNSPDNMVESTSFKNQILNIFISWTKKTFLWFRHKIVGVWSILIMSKVCRNTVMQPVFTFVFCLLQKREVNINPTEITPINQSPFFFFLYPTGLLSTKKPTREKEWSALSYPIRKNFITLTNKFDYKVSFTSKILLLKYLLFNL